MGVQVYLNSILHTDKTNQHSINLLLLLILTLKAPVTAAADDRFYNLILFVKKKIRYAIS